MNIRNEINNILDDAILNSTIKEVEDSGLELLVRAHIQEKYQVNSLEQLDHKQLKQALIYIKQSAFLALSNQNNK